MIQNYKIKIGIVLLFFLLPVFLFASSKNDAKAIIKKVLKKYDENKNIKVDFLQTFHWKLTENISEQKGTIWLEGKEKFKIESEDQTIVSDGTTVWIYSNANNQVLIDKVANAEDINLPRDILLNFSDTSRMDDQFIKQIKIWIETKKMILVKIEQTDLNKNVSSYLLSNFKTNVPISANFFKYEIPDTVEVIDMR